jgi:prephenate dehydratase
VAFQGEPGAFSEEAAIELLGADIELVPCVTFEELFRSPGDGRADYALAPVENTLAGTIQPCLDLLGSTGLIVRNEVTIPIAQHLIGLPGTSLEEIEAVESHPVALAQCQNFFTEHPLIKKVRADDTAGSVARILRNRDHKRAAIGGKRAAELYGGYVIVENVHDQRNNYTRFLLLALP